MFNTFRKAGISAIAGVILATSTVMMPAAVGQQALPSCCGTWSGALQLDNNGDGKFSKDTDSYLVGASVELLNVTAPDQAGYQIVDVDAYGRFLFQDIPYGSYVARVHVPEGYGLSLLTSGWSYAASTPDFVHAGAPADPNAQYVYSGVVEVSEVAPQPDMEQPLFVPTVGKVSGAIWFETDGDGVREDTDATGSLPEVEVQLMRRSVPNGPMKPIEEPWAIKTSSAKNGKFMFKHLPVGEYQLLYKAPEGYTFSADGADNSATKKTDFGLVSEPFQISAASSSVNMDAALTYAFAGDVYFDANDDAKRQVNERGVATARVELRSGNRVIAEVETDVNGRWFFSDIAAGDYTVRVQAPKPWQAATALSDPVEAVDFDVVVTETEVLGIQQVRLLPPAPQGTQVPAQTFSYIEPPVHDTTPELDFGFGPKPSQHAAEVATLAALWNLFAGGTDASQSAFAPQAGLRQTFATWFRAMLCELGVTTNCVQL